MNCPAAKAVGLFLCGELHCRRVGVTPLSDRRRGTGCSVTLPAQGTGQRGAFPQGWSDGGISRRVTKPRRFPAALWIARPRACAGMRPANGNSARNLCPDSSFFFPGKPGRETFYNKAQTVMAVFYFVDDKI